MLRKLTFILMILSLALAGCSGSASGSAAALKASGVIEADEILIAPEVGGVVAEMLVDEGDAVHQGDLLFRLTNDLLDAQYQQAQAALETAQAALDAAQTGRDLAQANLEAAQAGLQAAQAQLQLVQQAAREAEAAEREANWASTPPANYDLPNWYFSKDERLQAAQDELQSAQEALAAEEDNYQSVLEAIGTDEVREAETRLNQARAAFAVADALYQRQIAGQTGKTALSDYVKNLYDAAKSELEAAQRNYDQKLTQKDRDDLMDARARLTAAHDRVLLAQTRMDALQTGLQSPQLTAAQAAVAQAEALVKQAEAGVAQAEAAITQAKKGVAQAQAMLDGLDTQREKLSVRAPIDGVIASRSLSVGELAQPGAGALTLTRLDALTVTVYLPEDRYGDISLGQKADLRVDSFPDETFTATVIYIADQAEYTPRNVQTQEERVTTVYAVKLRVENAEGKLKPGMPADVTFVQP